MQNQKVCNKCGKEKLFSEFSKGNAKYNLLSWCKDCYKLYRLEHPDKRIEYKQLQYLNYKKETPWKFTFKLIKQRCNDESNPSYQRYGLRGIKCLITEGELKELWFRDKAYEMKKPSIDRIDNDGNYCIENCRYIELSENNRKNAITMPRNSKGIFIKRLRSK